MFVDVGLLHWRNVRFSRWSECGHESWTGGRDNLSRYRGSQRCARSDVQQHASGSATRDMSLSETTGKDGEDKEASEPPWWAKLITPAPPPPDVDFSDPKEVLFVFVRGVECVAAL